MAGSSQLPNSKVAIVHDWLVSFAGAERVLEQLLVLFPHADLFTLVDCLPQPHRAMLQGRKITTSFIQKLPFVCKRYRHYLPFMPLAVEQFNLSDYDLVISSSHAVAKGVITGPNQLHISYVHTPMRYAWDLQHQYLKQSGLDKGIKGFIAQYLLHRLRIWDMRTANGVDVFIANSQFIAQRIWKVYRRHSHVVYPPVSVHHFTPYYEKEDFYLVVSRLVPYKKVDIIIEAFKQMPNKRLLVIGNGPDFDNIQAMAQHCANITLLGFQPFDVVTSYLQRAKALVHAAVEDFGITLVEAQACATPVIALAQGGAAEIVKPGETGLLFKQQNAQAIIDAIGTFEQKTWSGQACHLHAQQFSSERFHQQFSSIVKHA